MKEWVIYMSITSTYEKKKGRKLSNNQLIAATKLLQFYESVQHSDAFHVHSLFLWSTTNPISHINMKNIIMIILRVLSTYSRDYQMIVDAMHWLDHQVLVDILIEQSFVVLVVVNLWILLLVTMLTWFGVSRNSI